mgnify:CR=1 FL=1
MFIIKNKYFLIIENIKDIDLKNIKKRNKFFIIYRNKENIDGLNDLIRFRKTCKSKAIKFYVANNIKLAILLKSDGIYLSSFNKELKFLNYKKINFEIIGSAHNYLEISRKVKQGCSNILFSKLFLVTYKSVDPYLGVIKFNNYLRQNNKLIPLGGINLKTLKYLNNINSEGLAIMTELKKKPAILRRLF